ncbi:MAG: hypothetical protein QM756_33730 [Polyangiaceae bacterium]
MKSLYAACSCALGVALSSGQARAEDCAPLTIEADGELQRRWPELPQRVRGAFEGRDGIEHCAQVLLGVTEPRITITVRLRDGRFTSRSVPRHADVIPALEALLLVPELRAEVEAEGESLPRQERELELREPAKPANVAPAVAPTLPIRVTNHETAPDGGRAPQQGLGIELSLVSTARVGDRQSALGLGVLSFANLGGWLLGFEGQANSYTEFESARSQGTLQLAAFVGRRFPWQSRSLDVIAGPAVALQGRFQDQSAPAGSGAAPTTTASSVPRLLVASHLTFGARSLLRSFVGVEAEFGSAGPFTGAADAEPPLPTWMAGVALGATVGTR